MCHCPCKNGWTNQAVILDCVRWASTVHTDITWQMQSLQKTKTRRAHLGIARLSRHTWWWLFIATLHNLSTIFARWHHCARPSTTLLTIQNDSLIGSAVFAWPMPHSPCTLHCAGADAPSFSPKFALCHWGSRVCNTCNPPTQYPPPYSS